jgi:hypothetical protein
MGDSRIKDVSALLSAFFDADHIRKGEEAAGFFSSWPQIVGPRLAAHSRIADVDKGILIIEAEHPGWIQLLQLRQSAVLEHISKRFPELGLRGVAFRLAMRNSPNKGKEKNEERRDPEPDPAPTPETEAEGKRSSESLANIPDEGFRALLSSLRDTINDKANH